MTAQRYLLAPAHCSLQALTAELAERGVKTDFRTVWTFAYAEGLSFKSTIQPIEYDPPDVARKCACWNTHSGQDRCPFGLHRRDMDQELHGFVARLGTAHAATCSIRLPAAIRFDLVSAPRIINGPIDEELFTRHVEKE